MCLASKRSIFLSDRLDMVQDNYGPVVLILILQTRTQSDSLG